MTTDSPPPISPAVDADSAPFWEACREGALLLPHCGACGSWTFPPSPICPVCRTREMGWDTVPTPTGTVYSLTVSAVPPRPGLPTPTTLVLVDIDGAPGARLTLRLREGTVEIGSRVAIEFDDVGPFTVPVAVMPDAGTDGPAPPTPAPHHAEPGRFAFEIAVPEERPEDRAVIGGVGRSAVGRALDRSELDLTVEAALAAVADAGLAVADIDGIASYPGAGVGPPGYAGPHTDEVARALGLQLAWHRAGAEGAGQLQPVADAVLAVAAGLCTHALVFRTCTEATTAARFKRGELALPGPAPAGGFLQWLLPFDAVTPAHWLAPYQARHMHRFGTTRQQVAAVSVVAREHAALDPRAVFSDPITIDDVLAARMISWPIGLLDCDVPVDGAVAVIVSRADRAGDLRDGAPVRVAALGTGVGFPPSWHQWPDLSTMAAHGAAASMWARTDLRPADVDVALLYDGFSFLSLFWLEAMGFVGHGEAGPFVEGGDRIRLGGDLPLNPHGGQLSGGRLHGWGFLEEAIHQVRGTATGRQVAGAEVAAVSTGGGPVAGCALLTRW